MDSKTEKAMEVFKRHYSPADTFKDSDEQLTTRAIYDKFHNLTYDRSLIIDQIHDIMKENGFQYTYFLDEFVWLLKIVKS